MGDVTYSSIQYYANMLAGSAACAYWDDERGDFHKNQVREAMTKLNELMEQLK